MIKVAIIGTGNISPLHIKGYLEFPERCKIVALVDIYPEKAQSKKENFQLDCDVYASHKELLGRADIDLIDICTPPFTHCEIATDFLKDGKNVLIEKPMAASLEECDMINAEALKSGKLLSIISQNRFNNPIWKLKKLLDTGIIGKIHHTQIESLWWRGHCYFDLWWRGSWSKENGGCTLNHAVHHIDMLCWMRGLPSQVTAVLTNTAHENAEVEDLSIAILKYDDGSLGQLTSSVVHHGEEQKLIFQGEKAKISAPWSVIASVSRANGFPDKNEDLEREIQAIYESIPEQKYEGHTAQIDNVLTALENGTSPLITGVDGRKTLELITSIYKSGSKNVMVKLPIDKDDDFYTIDGILKNVPYFYEKKQSIENFSDNEISLGSDYKKTGY